TTRNGILGGNPGGQTGRQTGQAEANVRARRESYLRQRSEKRNSRMVRPASSQLSNSVSLQRSKTCTQSAPRSKTPRSRAMRAAFAVFVMRWERLRRPSIICMHGGLSWKRNKSKSGAEWHEAFGRGHSPTGLAGLPRSHAIALRGQPKWLPASCAGEGVPEAVVALGLPGNPAISSVRGTLVCRT